MKTIYLYIKESPLGLKYLGKTERDPLKYKGSGLIWKRHLKKHNLTLEDIKTTILLETTNIEEIKNKGIYYSELYDVVNNEDWANLRPENGDGGDTSKFIDYVKLQSYTKGRGDTHWTKHPDVKSMLSDNIKGDKNPAKREEVKHKIRLKAIGRKASNETKLKLSDLRKGEKNAFYGKTHNENVKLIMKQKAKGRYSLGWFIEKYGEIDGNFKYKENGQRLSGKRLTKIIRTELKCPHCNFIGKGPNMKRYHFDKCKFKN